MTLTAVLGGLCLGSLLSTWTSSTLAYFLMIPVNVPRHNRPLGPVLSCVGMDGESIEKALKNVLDDGSGTSLKMKPRKQA